MSVGASIVGVLLVAICAHVGILLVTLGRAALPARRHPQRLLGLGAGVAALAGELAILRALLGVPAPLPWLAGSLGLALLLGFAARAGWREHAAGRLAFQAIFAAPLVGLLQLTLWLL